jgi:cyanate permease
VTVDAASTDRPRSRHRFAVEGAVWLLNFSMGMSFFVVSPLFPLIEESYGTSSAAVSLLVGGSSLVVALALIPGGVFAARIGSRAALATGGLLMSSVALAPLAPSFELLLATRVLFALGAAVTLGAAPAVVMRWFPRRELPVVNGANVTAQSLGVTVSLLVAAPLAEAVGWQGALFATGVVTAVATALWLVVARSEVGSDGASPPPLAFRDLRNTVTNRSTLLLGVGVAGGLGAFVALSAWLPTYYHEEFGFSLSRAGTVTAALPFFGIGGSLLGSWLSFRGGARRPFLVISGLLMPVAAVGTFVSDEPLLLFPSAALLGVAAWLYFPVAFTIPMELPGMTPERAGVAVATALSIGNVAAFASPLLVGVLRDLTGGFGVGLTICALLPLSLVAVGLLLRPSRGELATSPAAGR